MSDFDRNRDLDRDPRLSPRIDPRVRNNYGWGIPAAVVAAVLIIGGLWFASSRDVTTATNDRAPVTRTAPPGTSAPSPAPAPQK